MLNLIEAPSASQTYSHKQKDAIHITTLPSRSSQIDFPSFSIPIQYNLGNIKKLGEDLQFDLEQSTVDNQIDQWDGRAIPTFSLMNIKPLIENSNIDIPIDLKYSNDTKNVRSNFDLSAENLQGSNVDVEDILVKVNEGQNTTPDFEIERYQNFQNEDVKHFHSDNFQENVMDEFLYKNNFEKDDKSTELEDCHLLDSESNVAVTGFDNNL